MYVSSNTGMMKTSMNVITNMPATSFDHTRYFQEFSPGGELQINASYQLTKSISLGVGWTGFWIDSIARPSDMVEYVLEQDSIMGINNNNRQGVFSNWVTFSAQLNR